MSLHLIDLSSKVIAHRGASHYAPENTLSALRKAQLLKASWVEFDVMLTADNIPIVIHDETLERTTNGHGQVAQTSYADIAVLDAGSWFSKAFAGEKVPTLVDFLQCAIELGLGINVEIKPAAGKDQETALTVVQTLQQHLPAPQLNLLVSSFSVASLAGARSLDKSMCLGLLLDHWFVGWQDVLQQLECISLHANYRLLSPQKVAAVKRMGRYVLAYTVDDPELARKLYSWGVDAVFSNVPDVILPNLPRET